MLTLLTPPVDWENSLSCRKPWFQLSVFPNYIPITMGVLFNHHYRSVFQLKQVSIGQIQVGPALFCSICRNILQQNQHNEHDPGNLWSLKTHRTTCLRGLAFRVWTQGMKEEECRSPTEGKRLIWMSVSTTKVSASLRVSLSRNYFAISWLLKF
jgi:hypothetical protein